MNLLPLQLCVQEGIIVQNIKKLLSTSRSTVGDFYDTYSAKDNMHGIQTYRYSNKLDQQPLHLKAWLNNKKTSILSLADDNSNIPKVSCRHSSSPTKLTIYLCVENLSIYDCKDFILIYCRKDAKFIMHKVKGQIQRKIQKRFYFLESNDIATFQDARFMDKFFLSDCMK